jgi:hypothetical protein
MNRMARYRFSLIKKNTPKDRRNPGRPMEGLRDNLNEVHESYMIIVIIIIIKIIIIIIIINIILSLCLFVL